MSYSNILLIKLSAIGDVIHALPVPKALHEAFPGARLTWIVEDAARPLLDNNPYIHEVLPFDKRRYKSLGGMLTQAPALSRQLKSRRFDLALDLQGLAKSAALAFLSGAPAHYGYCNMREGSALVSRRICGPHARGHVVEPLLDVVRYLGGRRKKSAPPRCCRRTTWTWRPVTSYWPRAPTGRTSAGRRKTSPTWRGSYGSGTRSRRW